MYTFLLSYLQTKPYPASLCSYVYRHSRIHVSWHVFRYVVRIYVCHRICKEYVNNREWLGMYARYIVLFFLFILFFDEHQDK